MTTRPSGNVTELIFDDMALEVADPAEHDEVPASRVQFVGPVIESRERTSFSMTW